MMRRLHGFAKYLAAAFMALLDPGFVDEVVAHKLRAATTPGCRSKP